MLKAESTCVVQVDLASPDGALGGWERALAEARANLVPVIASRVLAVFEERLLERACGARRHPASDVAPFGCPRCGADCGFRRRGRRPRAVLSRVGRLQLRVAMVGCRCGHRFAPLLGALGIEPHARLAPGLTRRALELCSELPYARAAGQLRREAGAAPSPRSLGRLVRRAARRIALNQPRSPLGGIEAVLVDETRVRAGPRKGADDRGRELKIGIALRPPGLGQRIELLGANLADSWAALGPALRAARGARIAVTDGEWGARALIATALPGIPHQVCTFHVRHSLDHRLWQDGVPFARRRALASRLGDAIEFARSAESAQQALDAALSQAERQRWRHAARHLREVAPHLATWLRLDPTGQLAHTTSLLERTMREVNRRVDPAGMRWSLEGARAMTALVLARRFGHPRWVRLCHDRGPATSRVRIS
ncbi:MAG TPA: hypothetical protein DCK98_12500 [Chloroflexi bacterium]|nr:hypothetical protein [Chloroflexota bacterium]HAL28291.1 hypothetical protein [Chloroflexota bacterium]